MFVQMSVCSDTRYSRGPRGGSRYSRGGQGRTDGARVVARRGGLRMGPRLIGGDLATSRRN